MSITTCRECGENVSSEAEKCPACGIKNPAKLKNVFSMIGNGIGLVVFVFIGLAVIGYFSESSSQAKCKLLNNSLNSDVFLVKGEPDAGYRYNVGVINTGDRGEITITATLSTSEGEFSRKQTLVFGSQEKSSLSFTFHEPTVNASNVQGRLSCRPS